MPSSPQRYRSVIVAEDWQFYQRFGDALAKFSGIIEDASRRKRNGPIVLGVDYEPLSWRQIEKNISRDKPKESRKKGLGGDGLVEEETDESQKMHFKQRI